MRTIKEAMTRRQILDASLFKYVNSMDWSRREINLIAVLYISGLQGIVNLTFVGVNGFLAEWCSISLLFAWWQYAACGTHENLSASSHSKLETELIFCLLGCLCVCVCWFLFFFFLVLVSYLLPIMCKSA